MARRALVDANVLASRTCLDWLFHCRNRSGDTLHLFCSDDLLAEAVRTTRKRHPRAPGHVVAHRLRLIRACMDDVLTDFPGDVPFSGRDPDDYHVHAAALASGADVIVTDDDPRDLTAQPDQEPYLILTPDEFLLELTEDDEALLLATTRDQVDYWRSRPGGRSLDEALHRAGCPGFAARVAAAVRRIQSSAPTG